jgi:hypothetical protein
MTEGDWLLDDPEPPPDGPLGEAVTVMAGLLVVDAD